MGKQDKENRLVEFDRLNTVGKAVFIAGSAFTTLGNIVDFTVNAISDVWTLAEEAFRDGAAFGDGSAQDPAEEAQDAVVLEESER